VPVTMGEGKARERERERKREERGVCSSARGGKRVVKYRRVRREREKKARCCVRACVAASARISRSRHLASALTSARLLPCNRVKRWVRFSPDRYYRPITESIDEILAL